MSTSAKWGTSCSPGAGELSGHGLIEAGDRHPLARCSIVYAPLALTAAIPIGGAETTLDAAMDHFVTTCEYNAPVFRREYVDSLVQALLLHGTLVNRLYLPLALRQ
jgi:hypothetical protein